MKKWYVLKRGNGLSDVEINSMTDEDIKWWIDQIQKENEELQKRSSGSMPFQR